MGSPVAHALCQGQQRDICVRHMDVLSAASGVFEHIYKAPGGEQAHTVLQRARIYR